MKCNSELIVMLTYNDHTVNNAYRIFDECKNTKASVWGFKEEPLPLNEMKKLFGYMKQCGKTTALEVVAYNEKQCTEGALKAAECGCDILMGTVYSEKVHTICRENGLRYMPFIGTVTGRPSVLEGSIENMIIQANDLLKKGIYGFDLLGYRYTGDASELNRRFVSEINAPVCIAGSVNSFQRLDEIKAVNPWAFTIGSAFFDNMFGGTFAEQIDKVCDYINKQVEYA